VRCLECGSLLPPLLGPKCSIGLKATRFAGRTPKKSRKECWLLTGQSKNLKVAHFGTDWPVEHSIDWSNVPPSAVFLAMSGLKWALGGPLASQLSGKHEFTAYYELVGFFCHGPCVPLVSVMQDLRGTASFFFV
jgi:hypothetical protein